MKIQFITLLIVMTFTTKVNAQFFFIPIIIPSHTAYYNCPSKDNLANEYFKKGIDNYSKNTHLQLYI